MMKRILCLVSTGVMLLSMSVSAQWVASNNNMVNTNTGFVGIGTGWNLGAKFQTLSPSMVIGMGKPSALTLVPSGDGSWFNIANIKNGKKLVFRHGDMHLANDSTSWNGAFMVIQIDGKVGIGTDNPVATLDVNGSIAQKITNTGTAAKYTIGANDNVIIITSSTEKVILPTAVSSKGKIYTLKLKTINSIVEISSAGGKVEGSSLRWLQGNYSQSSNTFPSVQMISDGTDWYVLNINGKFN